MSKVAFRLIRPLTVTIVVFIFLINPQSILATPDSFDTAINTTYQVTPEGLTQVSQEISLTNKKADTYATQYALTLGSTRIKDITPLNSVGQIIQHSINKSDNHTTINLDFDERVVGRGQTHTFTVEYTDLDLAQRVGNVLEINLPKLEAPQLVDSYRVILLVPLEYGQPTIISPSTYQLKEDPVFTRLSFDDSAGLDQGITAIFGEKQIFEFHLTYHLKNDTVTPIETQIALPPDTPYQQMFYNEIQPPPISTFKDADGNWIAHYALDPKQIVVVQASGFATVYIEPMVPAPPPDTDLSDYLSKQQYWPIDSQIVKDTSASLSSPQDIYNYIVENFDYDYTRIDNQSTSRLGAEMALKDPASSLCLEFTDSYIALARSAGIPTRLLTGFAYTENNQLRPLGLVQDVLHAWPEYYNSNTKRWHPIDPTWGNTTGGIDYFNQIGFNHLVFAIQGSSPDRPFPAGLYTLDGDDSKNVQVNYSTVIPQEKVHFQTGLSVPLLTKLGLTNRSQLTVKNLSNRAFYQLPVDLTVSNATADTDQVIIDELIPYASTQIPVEFDTSDQNNSNYQLVTSIYGQQYSHTISSLPHKTILTVIALTLTAIILLIVGGFAYRSRRLLVS